MIQLLKRATFATALPLLGIFSAFIGVSQIGTLKADEGEIKNNISFGNKQAPVEVYVFTDWYCPACKQIEPAMEKFSKTAAKVARVIFVDVPVHANSLNFTPYNVAFMVNEKGRYFDLRRALAKLAEQTETPTDADIKKLTTPLGVHLKEVSYTDLEMINKYFKHLQTQFDITSTPTVVILNPATKKGKKLSGSQEITETAVLDAVNKLSKK